VLAGRLDGVDQHPRAGVVGDLDGLRHPEARPVVPGQRTETEQAGVRDGVFQRVHIEPPAVGFEHAHLDVVGVYQPVPGQRPRRVFEVRADDDVAGLEVDGGGDPRDAVSGAVRERDLVGVTGADEPGDAFAGAVHGVERHLVGIARRVGVVLVTFEEVVGGRDDPPRAGAARTRVHVRRLLERGHRRPEVLGVHGGRSTASGLNPSRCADSRQVAPSRAVRTGRPCSSACPAPRR